MRPNFADSVEGWTADLKAGVSADQVIASMASMLAQRLVSDIHEHDPVTADLDAFLDEVADDKRNPMATVAEEVAWVLNEPSSREIFRAVKTMPMFLEIVAEFEEDDGVPDFGMIGGDALVRLAMESVRETWSSRRENPAANRPPPNVFR
jgi:hypothetical protein